MTTPNPNTIPADLIASASAEHGDDGYSVLRTNGMEFLVRRPTRAEWKRFLADSGNPARRDVATENLVTTSMLWPDRAEFKARLERRPALCEELAEPVITLAGLTGQVSSGKS